MRRACGERFTRPALRQSPAFQGAAARCRASPSFHPAQGPDAECEARGEVISASLLPPNPWREPTSAAAVHVRRASGACRGSPVGSRAQVNSSSKAAASRSSSTINMRGSIPPRALPSLSSLDCVSGCAATTDRSTKARGARVLVARFEALDLPLGFVACDAVRLFNLIRKTRAPARNHVEVTGGKPPPVRVHLALELLPVGLRGIPVHLSLLGPRGPAAPVICCSLTSRRWRFPYAAIQTASLASSHIDSGPFGSHIIPFASALGLNLKSCRLRPPK